MAVAALLPATARALHRESPPVIAVTSGVPHEASPGRAWGNWLTFSSTEDLAHLGATRVPGRQIFVFNLDAYDCALGLTSPQTPCPPAGTPYLVQVTNGPGDPDHPSIGLVAAPPAPADQWIAYDAAGSHGGLGGPAGTRRQIFLQNLRTSERRTITAAGDGDSERPSVSQQAGLVVFQSTAALAGFPNPAGAPQIYAYERSSNVLRRISIGPGPSNTLALGASQDAITNATGSAIAFASRADLLGGGADTGTWQIYHAAYDSGAHTSTLTRVTSGNGDSVAPFLGDAPSGNVLVFESTATNLPGALGTPGSQLYEVDLSPAPSASVRQLTISSFSGDCFTPATDPGGTRLAFVCTGDPLQNGTSGRRLFVLDRPTTTLYQITGLGSVDGPVSANLGDWFVSFVTTSDLTSAGSCTAQLYVVDYFAGHWPAATLLGQRPGDVDAPNACARPCTTSAQCDDGNPCDGVETCAADGRCRPGTPIVCSDANVCNGFETCDPATGACRAGTPLACNDGNVCNGTETCDPTQGCRPGTPLACDDGNACNGVESCSPAAGGCVPGTPPVCNDGNPCTTDGCSPSTGCTFTPNTNPCDDGNACTHDDVCAGGRCGGVPVTCATCATCDPATGTCAVGPAPACLGGSGLRGQLALQARPGGGSLLWKWLHGDATDASRLGDPSLATDYDFCVYDGAGGLVVGARAPAGGTCGRKPCWQSSGRGGWRYVDVERTPDGLAKLLVSPGAAGKAKAMVKGKGSMLLLPSRLDTVALPLRTQLRAGGGACWELAFPASSVLAQEAARLRAKR